MNPDRSREFKRNLASAALKCGMVALIGDCIFALAIGRQLAARALWQPAPEKFWIVAVAIFGAITTAVGAVALYIVNRSRSEQSS